jgi:hypothetical protein
MRKVGRKGCKHNVTMQAIICLDFYILFASAVPSTIRIEEMQERKIKMGTTQSYAQNVTQSLLLKKAPQLTSIFLSHCYVRKVAY